MADEAKRRGRPATGRTAADRKRAQRVAAAEGRATAEAIRKATLEAFEQAVCWHCNDTSTPAPTVMQLLETIAEKFPEEERRRVYQYYMPAPNTDDIDNMDGGCMMFPNRRQRRAPQRQEGSTDAELEAWRAEKDRCIPLYETIIAGNDVPGIDSAAVRAAVQRYVDDGGGQNVLYDCVQHDLQFGAICAIADKWKNKS